MLIQKSIRSDSIVAHFCSQLLLTDFCNKICHERTSALTARGQVTFISEIARSTTLLHQPFIEPNDVKWRFAGQRAAAVLNCAAQADIVRASALCRVVR